jgi:hypothetical protein
MFGWMFAILHALGMFVVDLFTSRRRLQARTCSFVINSARLEAGAALSAIARR